MKADYHTQLSIQLRKAKKAKDAEAVLWYRQGFACVAIASYETMRGSWMHDLWRKRHAIDIAAIEAEFKRFRYLD